jgi:hypothetical protein
VCLKALRLAKEKADKVQTNISSHAFPPRFTHVAADFCSAMAAREEVVMRKSLIATAALMALGAIAYTGSASAAAGGPVPSLTAPADTITEVRMQHRMMRRKMSSHPMHRRMGGRQFQHRRMWGN